MTIQTIEIKQVIRRMRGASQAHLIQGDNGRFYVGKFCGNPCGNRVLINDWIATRLYQRLSLSTPSIVVLKLEAKTARTQGLRFQVDDKEIAIEAGLHLGSACPANPADAAIFDFLPASLLHKISNLSEFAVALVLDTFLGQTSSRQAIFVRERPNISSRFRAQFIAHGKAFNGAKWEVSNDASHAFFYNERIFSLLDTTSICDRAVQAVKDIDDDLLFRISEEIPIEWFKAGDRQALSRLFMQLMKRREQVGLLVHQRLEELTIRRTRHAAGFSFIAAGSERVAATHFRSTESQGGLRVGRLLNN